MDGGDDCNATNTNLNNTKTIYRRPDKEQPNQTNRRISVTCCAWSACAFFKLYLNK